ncbi:MAG: hemin uptake protein HemP [Proteobacteria bacterium]|nr:hemin uptake protein HemP [Pseudomonadota bacterium]
MTVKPMTPNTNLPPPAPLSIEPAITNSEPRRIDVGAVLADQREVVLMHNGEAYRLRITANNKLILTK